MANPRIVYTAPGASAKTIDFPATHRGAQLVDGGFAYQRGTAWTPGRSHLSVINETFQAFAIEFLFVRRGTSGDTFWADIKTWAFHAMQGVEFSLFMDADKRGTFVVNEAIAVAEAAWDVVEDPTASPQIAAQGDVLRAVLATDVKQQDFLQVLSAATGPNVITFEAGPIRAYPITTTILHFAESWPKCVVDRAEGIFRRRRAGRGGNVYDLRFTFETAL